MLFWSLLQQVCMHQTSKIWFNFLIIYICTSPDLQSFSNDLPNESISLNPSFPQATLLWLARQLSLLWLVYHVQHASKTKIWQLCVSWGFLHRKLNTVTISIQARVWWWNTRRGRTIHSTRTSIARTTRAGRFSDSLLSLRYIYDMLLLLTISINKCMSINRLFNLYSFIYWVCF